MNSAPLQIRFEWVCRPRRKTANYDAENVHLIVQSFPFLPAIGMHLKLTQAGIYAKVDDVYWDAAKPEEVQVFLEEPAHDGDFLTWRELKAEGWELGS